ncbi:MULTISPECIES: endonuclease/exonuclease/phosphatase family protein [Actinomadura]|uniref:Endonuclease/exonuclease/phosphatase family protein n=1 Tax=Actinomadura yumaensis TaxID=111807 RepID=A0ABW2CYE1_9ACTN|nr:endonuclease/exonuclease/phosphatase family protein [Actinomadura sp. J1-007]MWK35132.1 endonuclease/exonuclease/phosphatase family protein [Actinomadura sp. J1-007]
MRAPRALIPLFAVCGAAAVVAVAGAGAAIEGLPDVGSAHADGVRAVPGATITATTWNVCADALAGCPLGAAPAELGKRIPQRMRGIEVGGRKVDATAVFLQEVCSGHVNVLKNVPSMRGWTWAFAPSGGSCTDGQGRLGVALGTRAPMTGVRHVRLPAPARHERVAVCGDVARWHARVCATQLSAPRWDDDPIGDWRAKQVKRLTGELAGAERAILGGDLGERPESPSLDPLYQAYGECDQGPGPARTGSGTLQNARGQAVEKTDYLFASKSAGVSCGVPERADTASDHRPLTAVIRFRRPAEPITDQPANPSR